MAFGPATPLISPGDTACNYGRLSRLDARAGVTDWDIRAVSDDQGHVGGLGDKGALDLVHLLRNLAPKVTLPEAFKVRFRLPEVHRTNRRSGGTAHRGPARFGTGPTSPANITYTAR